MQHTGTDEKRIQLFDWLIQMRRPLARFRHRREDSIKTHFAVAVRGLRWLTTLSAGGLLNTQ